MGVLDSSNREAALDLSFSSLREEASNSMEEFIMEIDYEEEIQPEVKRVLNSSQDCQPLRMS